MSAEDELRAVLEADTGTAWEAIAAAMVNAATALHRCGVPSDEIRRLLDLTLDAADGADA